MTREQATRRVVQGITLADFLQAFRIGQRTLWHGVLAAAVTTPRPGTRRWRSWRRSWKSSSWASTVAAEAYVEAQQHAVAESDRVRRDLLEDLLALRASFGGHKRSLLRRAWPGHAVAGDHGGPGRGRLR